MTFVTASAKLIFSQCLEALIKLPNHAYSTNLWLYVSYCKVVCYKKALVIELNQVLLIFGKFLTVWYYSAKCSDSH